MLVFNFWVFVPIPHRSSGLSPVGGADLRFGLAPVSELLKSFFTRRLKSHLFSVAFSWSRDSSRRLWLAALHDNGAVIQVTDWLIDWLIKDVTDLMLPRTPLGNALRLTNCSFFIEVLFMTMVYLAEDRTSASVRTERTYRLRRLCRKLMYTVTISSGENAQCSE